MIGALIDKAIISKFLKMAQKWLNTTLSADVKITVNAESEKSQIIIDINKPIGEVIKTITTKFAKYIKF